MLTTDDGAVAARARLLLNHGMQQRYNYRELGYNLRLTEIAAAIGIKQLARLDELNRMRQENARFYGEHLAGLPGLLLPQVFPHRNHVFHQYTLRLLPEFPVSRAEFMRALEANGIGSAIYYPQPVYQYPYLSEYTWAQVQLPCAETLSQQVVSIPVHPQLTTDDRSRIVETIRSLALM